MRAFAVLLRRELTSRRMLLAASLAMGVVVAVVPLFVSRNGARPEEIRAAAAVAVALAWTVLLAIGLGATCLARDLGEHRLAFDFRLPAPATAIWSARLLGAYLTVLVAGLAVLLPSVLLGFDLRSACPARTSSPRTGSEATTSATAPSGSWEPSPWLSGSSCWRRTSVAWRSSVIAAGRHSTSLRSWCSQERPTQPSATSKRGARRLEAPGSCFPAPQRFQSGCCSPLGGR